ncbi:hypothetical protein BMETH_1657_0 [methanotrophic bacterial endosymbiont of Bathymodiolus sp.]|nr:hypothetical protein BMETH_1657_0 [methanotrophic bacterial endosymbiont of Bathymodiolus sp.]
MTTPSFKPGGGHISLSPCGNDWRSFSSARGGKDPASAECVIFPQNDLKSL